MQFYKRYVGYAGLCSALFSGPQLFATPPPPPPYGLIGGQDYNTSAPLGAFVSPSGQLTNLDLSSLTSYGPISSVALNDAGAGLIGGQDYNTSAPLGALVSPSGLVTDLQLSSLTSYGSINSVALNNAGAGLIGGEDSNASAPLGALVSPSGLVTDLNLSSSLTSNGVIYSVALNNGGAGLIGGYDNNGDRPPLGALVSPSGQLTNLDLSSSLTSYGSINSVALNNAGAGLIGGQDYNGDAPPLGALVSPSGLVTNLNLSSLTSSGYIYSVALNNAGAGLIGGYDNNGDAPLGALVSPSGQLTNLDLSSLTSFGYINSVALNNGGAGLIGGQDLNANAPLGALVSPSGLVTDLQLSSLTSSGVINSVALNNAGAGLVGGYDYSSGNDVPLAALITPSGQVIKLNLSSLTSSGVISSVALSALSPLLSGIPTAGLRGNNLVLANYLNANAPDESFYFLPSEMDGTFSQALESVAPTRNAFLVFTADNNFFLLENSFTQHVVDSRSVRRSEVAQGELLTQNEDAPLPIPEKRPYQVWGKMMGAATKQKAQHQAPTFQPWTSGFLLGFDAHVTRSSTYGLGIAYAHTYVHDKQGAGHCRIEQEYLFSYGVWEGDNFYGNAAIWGGLFQGSNLRDIAMTGFAFKSTSHPKGWQLAPHAEVGYRYDLVRTTFEPFAMFDWISNWLWSYKEKGSGPFNFSQRHQYSSFLRSELGLRLYETRTFSLWKLVLQEKVSYVNKKPFHVGRVTAGLIGAPGSFTVETFTTPQNLGAVGAEMLFAPINPCYPYGSIAYQGEFGPHYQSHQLSMNLAWHF